MDQYNRLLDVFNNDSDRENGVKADKLDQSVYLEPPPKTTNQYEQLKQSNFNYSEYLCSEYFNYFKISSQDPIRMDNNLNGKIPTPKQSLSNIQMPTNINSSPELSPVLITQKTPSQSLQNGSASKLAKNNQSNNKIPNEKNKPLINQNNNNNQVPGRASNIANSSINQNDDDFDQNHENNNNHNKTNSISKQGKTSRSGQIKQYNTILQMPVENDLKHRNQMHLNSNVQTRHEPRSSKDSDYDDYNRKIINLAKPKNIERQSGRVSSVASRYNPKNREQMLAHKRRDKLDQSQISTYLDEESESNYLDSETESQSTRIGLNTINAKEKSKLKAHREQKQIPKYAHIKPTMVPFKNPISSSPKIDLSNKKYPVAKAYEGSDSGEDIESIHNSPTRAKYENARQSFTKNSPKIKHGEKRYNPILIHHNHKQQQQQHQQNDGSKNIDQIRNLRRSKNIELVDVGNYDFYNDDVDADDNSEILSQNSGEMISVVENKWPNPKADTRCFFSF